MKFTAGRSGVFSQCRDKDSLDIFWLRDESLEEADNLPDPDVLAQEIVEDLEAALEQFREIARFSMLPSLHRKIRKLTNDVGIVLVKPFTMFNFCTLSWLH